MMNRTKSKEKDNQNTLLQNCLSLVKELILAAFIGLFITNFIICRGVVVGHSMDDTLYDGENFIVNRLSYKFMNPERFDIIIIENPDFDCIVKRVIGLPGETVQIDEQGNIYINGEILEEHYGKETINNAGNAAEPILLGENQYFVLGDNRNNSSDSRFSQVGLIEEKDIIGKLLCTLF